MQQTKRRHTKLAGSATILAVASSLLALRFSVSETQAAAPRRSLHIVGLRNGTTLSGTVIVTVSLPAPSRKPNDHSNALVVLTCSDMESRSIAARVSAAGTASLVLDTAQILNGSWDITVSDLRGHSDTRHIRIENPLSETGYFLSREGLPMQSKRLPEVIKKLDSPIFHAGVPDSEISYLPAICSESSDFELHFVTSRPGAYRAEISDERNQLVRSLSLQTEEKKAAAEKGKRPEWYLNTDWDGKDNQGQTAPDGDYQVRVQIPGRPNFYQSFGFVHKGRVAASPQQSPGGSSTALRFTDLQDGRQLSGDVLINITPEPKAGHVRLLLDGEPIAASPVEIAPGGLFNKRLSLPVRTMQYPNGPHVLEARDFYGHSTQRPVVFRNPVSQVRYEPDLDRNGAGIGTRYSHFTATLPTAQPWQAEIINAKGRPVRTFRGTGQTILLAWDGNDDHGQVAPDGKYEIVLRHASRTDTLGYIQSYVSTE